jgi:hypothetical protein
MTRILDRQNLARWVDWFAVAVALVLPWSTTFTAVFIVLWFFSVLGSWNIAERLREPWLAAGYLPALLWLIAGLGMLWASVPWGERFAVFSAFHKACDSILRDPVPRFPSGYVGSSSLFNYMYRAALFVVGTHSAAGPSLAVTPESRRSSRNDRGPGERLQLSDHYNSQTTMFMLCILGLAESTLRIWHNG